MGPAKNPRTAKAARRAPLTGFPIKDQDKRFCERWLVHFDKDRAFREAGFACNVGYGTRALNKLEQFAEYLRPLREAKAKVVAERLAIDGDAVLQGMTKRVFFDPTMFFERASEPLTEWVHVPGCTLEVQRPIEWDGKPVYGERLKPYADLTPEQRQVVEITGESGGQIHYRLPTIREQHMFLTSLGKQFGLFAEKLIMERHLHKHTHAHLTFENVPTQKLTALTRQMLPLVGLEFAQSLGYTAADIEQAALEEGVVMTVAAKASG